MLKNKKHKHSGKNPKGNFLNLNVKVFENRRNGQQMIILPKRILKDIPPKMDIKIQKRFFKSIREKGGNK